MKKLILSLLMPLIIFGTQSTNEPIERLEKIKTELLDLHPYRDTIKNNIPQHAFIQQLKNDPIMQQYFDTLSDNFFSSLSSNMPLKNIFEDALNASHYQEKIYNHITKIQWKKFISDNNNPELLFIDFLMPNFHFIVHCDKTGEGCHIIESNMLIEHIIGKIDVEIEKIKDAI